MGCRSNVYSGKRPTRVWSVVSNLCILSPTLLGIGCETSQSDVSSSQRQDEAAKADFDWAMMRLRRAIETFTPPANLGLKMTRKLSYELIPPDATQPLYTAQVTVDSKTAYQPRRFFPSKEGDLDQGGADSSAFAENLKAARANNPTASPEGYLEGAQTKALVVDALVDAPSIEEQIVYELIYRDERWQLETQPDSKHEQMWFEYALQQ